MTWLRGAARLIAAVAAIATTHAQSQPAVSPLALLQAIPARVERVVLPVQGMLAGARGVDRWRLLVNDGTIFESAPRSGGSATPIRIGVILRPGDNLITLEALAAGEQGEPVERWSTHVHRTDPTPTQFALLAAGDSDPRTIGHLESVRVALIASGVRPENIVQVSDAARFAAELSELGPRTRSRDQVLIYYSGPGRVGLRDSEPELLFQRDARVPVSSVIRESSDLPGTSLLLDIVYIDPSRAADGPVQAAARIAPSARWLGDISDAAIEVAYTNPSAGATHSAIGFTADFVREWQQDSGGECKTFARIVQSVATANAQKAATWPVYFAHGDSSFLFCPGRAAAVPQLSIRPVPDADVPPPFTFVEVSLPGRSAASELRVDGVPLPIVPGSPETMRVPLGPGLHVIDARPAVAGDAALLIGQAGCAGPPATGVPCAPLTSSSQRRSETLLSRVEPGLLPKSTSEETVAMSFVVGGETNDIRYQIRNNGVVVRQEAVKLSARVLRRQIVQRIPLVIGTNNLAVDVVNGGMFASSRVTVERRRSQAVRAVVVGVDAPSDAPPLLGAVIDARRMHELLLRYTDASPGDVQLLTGADATRDAVLQAIARFARPATTQPRALADDSTFLLYFAGYGLTYRNAQGGVTRCLVTAGFERGRAAETCLSTHDVDASLDQVGRAIVIADTSYDGPAGPGSRTYSTYEAAEAAWRQTSGIDRPDRMLLVAGESNSTAHETADGGVFTQALAQIIGSRLGRSGDAEVRGLSLLDAYDGARVTTAERTNRSQVPVLKGVLSEPFHFVRSDAAALVPEANSIERAARNDLAAMRALNLARLARAESLYEKALAESDRDVGAHLGIARIRALRGELAPASEALKRAQGLLTSQSTARAEWLSISADLRMQGGDIAGAVEDAREATTIDAGNQIAAAQLGLLLAIQGEYGQSLDMLTPLLSARATQVSALTEDERGRLLLHTYLALRQTGQHSDAELLLRSYFANLRGKAWMLRIIFQNAATKKLLSRKDQIVELGQVGVQTPWSHLVAQFFLDREKYEPLLVSFFEDTKPYDPRDHSAFACLSEFYRGAVFTLNEDRPDARKAFTAAVATGKTVYAEYWMAQAQLNRARD